MRITDGRASYYVYAINSLEVDLTLEYRLASLFRVALVLEYYLYNVVMRLQSETS